MSKPKDCRTPSEASPRPFLFVVHPKDAPYFEVMLKGGKHLRRFLKRAALRAALRTGGK